MDPTTIAPTSLKATSGILINRDYALLWIGQSLSNVGDFVYNTALVLWVTQLLHGVIWAPLAVSGIFIATFLPQIIVGPLAGVFVDRWDNRRTLLRMDSSRVVLIALLVLATGAVPLPFFPQGQIPVGVALGTLYLIIFIAEACGQFFNPARTTLMSDIVPTALQPRAVGLGQVTQSLAIIIGPPIAALLFYRIGVQGTLLLNAASFLISYLCIHSVRATIVRASTSAAQPRFWNEFFIGLRFAVDNKVISTLIIAGVIILFGAAPLNSLGVFFLQQNLHASTAYYGYLDSALGIGTIVGAIIFSMLATRIGLSRLLISSLLLAGVLVILYARMTSFTPAIVLLMLFGFFQAGMNIAISPLFIRAIPRAMLGRVLALFTTCIALASLVSIAITGFLDSSVLHDFHATIFGVNFGPIDTISTVGGLLVVLAALYTLVRLGFTDPATDAQSASDAKSKSQG